jgi:hypothetical protein
VLLIGLPGLLLALTVYFTRPTPRRLAGALAAGVVVASLNVLVDVVAYAEGWWRSHRLDAVRSTIVLRSNPFMVGATCWARCYAWVCKTHCVTRSAQRPPG